MRNLVASVCLLLLTQWNLLPLAAQQTRLPFEETQLGSNHVLKASFPATPQKSYSAFRLFGQLVNGRTLTAEGQDGLAYRLYVLSLPEGVQRSEQEWVEEGLRMLTGNAEFRRQATVEPLALPSSTPYRAWSVDYRPGTGPNQYVTVYIVEDKLYLAEAEYMAENYRQAELFSDAISVYR
jgi:hypothetical protein